MCNITAITTPYNIYGKINWKIIHFLILYFIFNKINNILFLGTTGESNIFNKKDYFNLSKFIYKYKIKCYFGIVKNNILDIINICFILKINNIIAILISPLSFILPNNIYIYKYFKVINKIGIPIIFYNIPKRNGLLISLILLKKMLNKKFFFSIKNSFNNKNNLLIKLNNTIFFLGNDSNIENCKKLKFSGIISVLSNCISKHFNYLSYNNSNYLIKLDLNKNPIFIKYIMYKNCLLQNINCFFDIFFFFFTQSQT